MPPSARSAWGRTWSPRPWWSRPACRSTAPVRCWAPRSVTASRSSSGASSSPRLRRAAYRGVHLVISDAHAGLKVAVAQQFTNSSWQRCRVHFMRNLHTAVSAKHAPAVTAAVKTIFAHTEPDEVAAQWDRVADTLAASFPKVAAMMGEAKTDVLAFTAFPKAHWQKIWSNNPIERLNKEIKRRADVVEIFPNPAAFLRLATAVVIESHDEWQVTRRYLSDVSMDELRAVIAAKHAAAALAKQHQIA
nr:transposase [Mycolicibacterium sp. TY66]